MNDDDSLAKPTNNLIKRHRISSWLPSRGNVVFVLVVAGALLFYEHTAGAAPGAVPTVASTSAIPYQGRLADTSGNPLEGSYAMTFRLYNIVSGGSALWTETWTGGNSVVVSKGLFNIMLGSLTPISATLFSGNSSLWLGLTIGADSEMAPRVQLGSVPYSMQAQVVPNGSITLAKLAPELQTTLRGFTPAVRSLSAAPNDGLHEWTTSGTSKAIIAFKVPNDYVSGDLAVRETFYENDTAAGSVVKMSNDIIVYSRLGGSSALSTANADYTFGTSYWAFTIAAGTFSPGRVT